MGALNRTALTVEARVRGAWYDLLLARSLDLLVEERRETARQIESTTRERYAAGLAVQQDVLRAQVELARIDELKAAQRAVIAGRLAEINRLLGRPQDAALDTPAALPDVAAIPATAGIVAGGFVLGRATRTVMRVIARRMVRIQGSFVFIDHYLIEVMADGEGAVAAGWSAASSIATRHFAASASRARWLARSA